MYLTASAFPITSLCAATSAYQLANDVGRVAGLVQRASSHDLMLVDSSLEEKLSDWRANGIRGAELDAIHVAMTGDGDARLLADRLLALEGRLWGEMVASGHLNGRVTDKLRRQLARTLSITRSDVEQASRWIRQPWLKAFLYHSCFASIPSTGNVQWTSLVQSFELGRELGRPVFLKLESEQSVGSFKNRGATNLLVNYMIDLLLEGVDPQDVTVVTASHGNAAQGVVQAARNLGISQVKVYLPKNASPLKMRQLIAQGAELHLRGETFEEAEDVARAVGEKSRTTLFIPAFRHDLIAAGQGSIGIEIETDMQTFGHKEFAVVAGAGGLGLLSGLTVALEGKNPLFGAESELLAYGSRSFGVGAVVEPGDINHIDTVADGSALLRIDGQLFERYIKEGVQDIVAIPEMEIQGAIAALDDLGVAAEGSAAAPLGAALFGGLRFERYDIPGDLPLVFVISGRNIDDEMKTPLLEKYGQGRWRTLNRAARTNELNEFLTKQGYVRDNVVLPLIEDAKPYHYIRVLDFVDMVASRLPDGWDLIDAFRELDFGPHVKVKGPRATFRSMGEYATRAYLEDRSQQGNRLYALFHPVANRANIVIQAGAIATADPEKLAGLLEALEAQPEVSLAKWLSRLAGEARVIEHYAHNPAWMSRLVPELSSRERGAKIARLLDVVARLKRAMEQLLPHFEPDHHIQLQLLSAVHQALPQSLKK